MKKVFIVVAALLVLLPIFVFGQEKPEEIRVSYKDGLIIEKADGSFSMKLSPRAQFQFSLDDREVGTRTPSFNVRRARIVWNGNAFYPWLKYEIQLTLEGSAFSLRDCWVDFAGSRALQPRVGQFKLPFNREFLTSSTALQFVDRSIVNDEFQVGRDIGAALRGHLGGDRFEYGLGVFNGSAKNRPNRDRTLIYVGRAMLNLLSKSTYSQADLEHSTKPVLAIGAALAILPDFKPALEGVDDRANLARAVLAAGVSASNVKQLTADLLLKLQGVSLEGEYHLRSISRAEIRTVFNRGFRVGNGLRLQAGRFFVPKIFEAALRYAAVDPDTDANDDAVREITPALSYYVSGHRLKFQADFSFITTQQPGDDLQDRRARCQMQVSL
jgi:hypothetical protein